MSTGTSSVGGSFTSRTPAVIFSSRRIAVSTAAAISPSRSSKKNGRATPRRNRETSIESAAA